MKERRFRPSLWVLVGLGATILLTLLIGAVFVAFRTVVQERYLSRIKDRMEASLVELRNADFSPEAAKKLEDRGINVLIFRDASGSSYYRSTLGPMFYLPFAHRSSVAPVGELAAYYDRVYLSDLVRNHLGGRNGSVCITERNQVVDEDLLSSRELYLIGREGPVLFGLSIHLTNANDAITLAVQWAAIIWSVGWGVCILLIYLASREFRNIYRSYNRITGKIAEMDFSERCTPKRTREMDELSRSINAMSDRLRESISELTRTNERLQAELAEQERQKRLTGELIGNISHDLKTPVAVISGCVEGLQEGIAASPEQRSRYYETIAYESEQMQAIISRLLALCRAERSAPLTPTDFDLSAVLDEAIEGCASEIRIRGLELETSWTRPLAVHADRTAILQCVCQYVQNAFSYVDARKKIRVAAEPEGACVRVSVRNSADPIPDEEAPKLWEKLYRGDKARASERGRAGVGLAIVKSSLERQGFAYGLRNLDEGVEFWFSLPRAGTDSEPAEAEPKAEPGFLPETPGKPEPNRGKNVQFEAESR